MIDPIALNLTTLLFVPANKPRMVDKAQTLDAPAVIVDLEDGVGIGEKGDARSALSNLALHEWRGTSRLFFRVNGPTTAYFQDDIRAAVRCKPFGICVPKCETASDVRVAAAEIMRSGPTNRIWVLPFVESARGIQNAFEIVGASDRVVAVALGSEDLAADLGMRRTRHGAELQYFRSTVVCAARASGVQAIDGVFIDFNDPEGLHADASAGRALGMDGKQIIHPSQIDIVAQAYAPTADELDRARRIVAAFDEAEREGRGVVVVDGRMIDRPIVLQARRLVGTESTP